MDSFKLYCESVNKPLFNHLDFSDEKLKQSVELYMKMEFLPMQSRYVMIINDIKKYNNDIILILQNGTLKVNKNILTIIPYFKNLFEIFEENINEIYLKTTVELMMLIIESIYFQDINVHKIHTIDIIDLLELIDMLMLTMVQLLL